MLVTLTNGLQISASFVSTDGDDGSNDCMLKVSIESRNDLHETGKGYADYESSEVLKDIALFKDRGNGFALMITIPYYRIHSIVDHGACPYNEPFHKPADCPACDSTYKPSCTPSLEEGSVV